jgi:dihydroneopterin aldolase
MTRIWVSDMRFFTRHGILPEEARDPQLFSVDVEIWLDSDRAGAQGELKASVDYRSVWDVAYDVMMGPREGLLERLGYRMADTLFVPPAKRVLVRVRKLTPPLPGSVAESGAEVIRE